MVLTRAAEETLIEIQRRTARLEEELSRLEEVQKQLQSGSAANFVSGLKNVFFLRQLA